MLALSLLAAACGSSDPSQSISSNQPSEVMDVEAMSPAQLLTPKAPSASNSEEALNPDPMSPERLHYRVQELTKFQPRWAGYPAERWAGEWIAERLRNAGVDTVIEPYSFRKWQLNDWDVNLIDGDGSESLKSLPVWSSHAGEGTAELVDAGFGTEAELLAQNLQGKAVVITGKALLNVFGTYSYHRASELGAVATFGTTDAPDNLIRPTSEGANKLDDNEIPAFHLGARDLARMREAARNGGSVSWRLEAQHVDGTTHDVIGRLPGSGELEGAILVTAHYDAWFSGALDNATGVAGLIGLAEHFASLPIQERPRDMIFLAVTGHDVGYPHGGAKHWVSAHKELIPALDLYVNLDHLAAQAVEHVSGAGIVDLLGITVEHSGDEKRALFTTREPTLISTFLPYLVKYGLMPAGLFPTLPEVNVNPDVEGTISALGVPSVNLSMATPYYHTTQDTPDRIPAEQLSRAVRAHRDFITDMIGKTNRQIRFPLGS